MRRKAPRIGDLVMAASGRGLVTETVGIHLYVRLMRVPYEGHSGTEVVRRDSVDVIARAEHA
jgi:hypothetical protein